MKHTLYKGDCLEVMKNIKDKSIDLAIYDAPYYSTNIKEVGDRQWKSENDYIEWCINVIKETQRVLKNNGSFYWFHNNINIMVEILYRIKRETDLKLKNQITWDKLATGNQDFLMPLYKNSNLKRRYGTSLTEYIYYFTFDDDTGLSKVYEDDNCFSDIKSYLRDEKKKSGLSNKDLSIMFSNYTNKDGCKNRSVIEHYFSKKQWVFPTKDIYENVLQKTGFWNKPYEELLCEYNELKLKYDELIDGYEQMRYCFNQPYLITSKDIEESRNTIRPYSTVWHYKRNDEIYKNMHATPKPIDMIKHVIETSSKENFTILDCFMGSNSTGIACLNTNRNYIGIEKDDTYFNVSIDRTQKHIQDNNIECELEIIK